MTRLIRVGVFISITWSLIAGEVLAQPCSLPLGSLVSGSPASDSPASELVNRFNTTRRGNVIVLGRTSDSPYVVVVPVEDDRTLPAVRRCVRDAFLSQSHLGLYVHAGAFGDFSAANWLSRSLRKHGLDARVIYAR